MPASKKSRLSLPVPSITALIISATTILVLLACINQAQVTGIGNALLRFSLMTMTLTGLFSLGLIGFTSRKHTIFLGLLAVVPLIVMGLLARA